MRDPLKDGPAWHPFQPWAIVVIVVVVIGVCAGVAFMTLLLK